MKVHRVMLWTILTIFSAIVVYGVYFIPDNQALIKANDPDATAIQLSIMANQVSSMNYLLTFIGLAGAIAGVAFTIFGYYQSTKFPDLVKKEVVTQINSFIQQEKSNNKRITDEIKQKEDRIYRYLFEVLIVEKSQKYNIYDPKIENNLTFKQECDLYLKGAAEIAHSFKNDRNVINALDKAIFIRVQMSISKANKKNLYFNTPKYIDDKQSEYIESKLADFRKMLKSDINKIPSVDEMTDEMIETIKNIFEIQD